MSEFELLGYEKIAPATWAYVSSLLMIGLFFKFSRVLSVRNFDLFLLIALAPGLLMQHFGDRARAEAAQAAQQLLADRAVQRAAPPAPQATEHPAAAMNALAPPAMDEPPAPASADDADARAPRRQPVDRASAAKTSAAKTSTDRVAAELPALQAKNERGRRLEWFGHAWLFVVGLLLTTRMLGDSMMVRRPLLEPNLSTGGLVFIGCAMFVFLMANVATSQPTPDDLSGPRRVALLLGRSTEAPAEDDFTRHGPGYPLVHVLPSIATWSLAPTHTLGEAAEPSARQNRANELAARAMAILSHLAVVLGVTAIGYWHFDNLKMGVGVAVLYLILPYTAHMTGRVHHVLPAALLVWAVFSYRRPLWAGVLLGLASAATYYPFFLLPLWISFYAQRGLRRFLLGVGGTLALVAVSLIFVSSDFADFVVNLQRMFGVWTPKMKDLNGLWSESPTDLIGLHPGYRLPTLVAFVGLCGALAIWPAQKNLGTLLSCSAAVMAATQLWHGQGGGLYLGWYLPLLLLTSFRPNLEDRVAMQVLSRSWAPRRRVDIATGQAA